MGDFLLINWHKSPEMKGGTEIVFGAISKILNVEIIDSKKAHEVMRYQYQTYYHHALVDRTIIFDKFIKDYEKVNEPKIIIRNSACGGLYKPKTKIVTFFQDPYKYVGDFMLKIGDKSMENEFCHTYPLFQRLSGENSFNIANSEYMKSYMDEIGVKCDKIIPLGVDLDFFSPVSEEHKLPERQQILKKYKKIGLIVTKFHPLKYTFVPEIIKSNQDIFWYLVVSGAEQKLKVHSGNVRLFQDLGQEALRELYRSADFTISTSPIESFGLTQLESLACGTPIIAFNTGFLWNKEDFKGGIIVKEHTLLSFQRAIEELDKHTFSPREEAEKYDIKKFEDELLKTIEELNAK